MANTPPATPAPPTTSTLAGVDEVASTTAPAPDLGAVTDYVLVEFTLDALPQRRALASGLRRGLGQDDSAATVGLGEEEEDEDGAGRLRFAASDVTPDVEALLRRVLARALSIPVAWVEIVSVRETAAAGTSRRLLATIVAARVPATSHEQAQRYAGLARGVDFASELAGESPFAAVSIATVVSVQSRDPTTTSPPPTTAATPAASAPGTTPPSAGGPPLVVAAPSRCAVAGGTTVMLSLSKLPALPATAPTTLFAPNSSPAASAFISSSAVAVTCPPSSQASQAQGQVLGPDGAVLAVFAFAYVVPPPSLSPSRVLLLGGLVDLSISGSPPPALPPTCAVKVRGVLADVISSDSSPTAALVRFRAPRLTQPGPANVTLDCMPDLSLSLEYGALPSVGHLSTPAPAGCVAWQPCAVSLSILAPPRSIAGPADVAVTCSGIALDPFPGSAADMTPRVAVDAVSPAVLALTLTLPPPSSAGALSCLLAPTAAPDGIAPADLAVLLSVSAVLPAPAIVSVAPSFVSAGSAATIRVETRGFGPVSPSSGALSVSIGGVAVPATVLFADKVSGAFSLDVPASLPVGTLALLLNIAGRNASKRFTVTPSDSALDAACVEGCRVGFGGGRESRFVIQGLPAGVLPGEVVAEVNGQQVVVQAIEGDVVTVILPALTAENEGSDPVESWLQVSLVASPDRYAVIPVTYMPAPKLVTAQLSADGGDILVTANQPTTASGSGDCAQWVRPDAGSGSLGEAPRCAWEAPSRLRVVPGRGASIMPRDTLLFVALGVTALGGSSDAIARHAVAVSAPAVLQVPEIVVSGPPEVGSCDDVVLFASGSSARALTFTWRCPSSEAIDLLLASVSGNEAIVPGSLLALGEPTLITVVASTFLGAQSSPVEHQVIARAVPPPLVTLDVPPPPYLASAPLFFSATCRFSVCSQDASALTFNWFISEGDALDPALAVFTGSQVALDVPAGTLAAGTRYQLTLITSQGEGLPVRSSRSFTTGHSALVAAIEGGDRTVWAQDTAVLLDASASHDPDSQPVSLEWACASGQDETQLQACRDQSSDLQLTALTGEPSGVLSLDLSSLLLRASDLVVLTATVRGTLGRFAEASVTLHVSDAPALAATIEIVAMSSTRIACKANVDSPPGQTALAWSVSGPGLDTAAAQSALDAMARTGWEKRQLVLIPSVDASAALFVPGVDYHVKLHARAGGVEGESQSLLRVPLPPTGGVCTVSRATAAALVEDLEVTCQEWRAESLPLQYRFGFVEGDVWDPSAAEWTSERYLSRFKMRLDEGKYQVAAQVMDAYGGATQSAVMSVEFEATTSESASEDEAASAMDRAFESLDRLGSTAQLLQAAGSVMKRLNKDSDAGRSTGGARKLLASSAAYRMRVRRMLLRGMQGSVNASLSPKSSGAVLTTTAALSSASSIGELTPGVGEQSVQSLERAASMAVQQPTFSEQDLQSAMTVCNAVLFASRGESEPYMRDRVVKGAMRALQLVTAAYARLMLEEEQPVQVVLENVAVEVRKAVPGDNSTVVVQTEAAAGGLLSAGLHVPVRSEEVVGVVQARLFEDVWDRDGAGTTITSGVVGVILVEEPDEDRLPCHGVCLSVTVPVDLSDREAWELEAFRHGLAVECLRWQSDEWSSEGCVTWAQFNDSSLPNASHSVRCACSARSGLFRVAFDPPPHLWHEAPFPISKLERRAHGRFLIAAVVGAAVWLVCNLLLVVILPRYYQRKWLPFFDDPGAGPELYTTEKLDWFDLDGQILGTKPGSQRNASPAPDVPPTPQPISADQRHRSFRRALRRLSAMEAELGIVKAKHAPATPLRAGGGGSWLDRKIFGVAANHQQHSSSSRQHNVEGSNRGGFEASFANFGSMHGTQWQFGKSVKQSVQQQALRNRKEAAMANLIAMRSTKVDLRSLEVEFGINGAKLLNQDGMFWEQEVGQPQRLAEGPFALNHADWFHDSIVSATRSSSEWESSAASRRSSSAASRTPAVLVAESEPEVARDLEHWHVDQQQARDLDLLLARDANIGPEAQHLHHDHEARRASWEPGSTPLLEMELISREGLPDNVQPDTHARRSSMPLPGAGLSLAERRGKAPAGLPPGPATGTGPGSELETRGGEASASASNGTDSTGSEGTCGVTRPIRPPRAFRAALASGELAPGPGAEFRMDAGPGQPVPVAAPQAPARSGLQMREHSEWRAEAAREAARQVAEDAARAEAEQRSRAAEWRSRDPERDQALRVTGGALVREMSAQAVVHRVAPPLINLTPPGHEEAQGHVGVQQRFPRFLWSLGSWTGRGGSEERGVISAESDMVLRPSPGPSPHPMRIDGVGVAMAIPETGLVPRLSRVASGSSSRRSSGLVLPSPSAHPPHHPPRHGPLHPHATRSRRMSAEEDAWGELRGGGGGRGGGSTWSGSEEGQVEPLSSKHSVWGKLLDPAPAPSPHPLAAPSHHHLAPPSRHGQALRKAGELARAGAANGSSEGELAFALLSPTGAKPVAEAQLLSVGASPAHAEAAGRGAGAERTRFVV